MPEQRPCIVCGEPVKTLGGVVYAGTEFLPGTATSMEPTGVMLEVDGQHFPCHYHCIEQAHELVEDENPERP